MTDQVGVADLTCLPVKVNCNLVPDKSRQAHHDKLQPTSALRIQIIVHKDDAGLFNSQFHQTMEICLTLEFIDRLDWAILNVNDFLRTTHNFLYYLN